MKPINIAVAILFTFTTARAQQKPKVFVTDSQSWETTGRAGGSADGFAGISKGGARPQTVEIIKTFGEECSNVTVTTKKEGADYTVLLDHEGGKGALRRDNKFALVNKDGDVIKSGSTRSLGNAVKDACKALFDDWTRK
jgi:hypothetical protein